MIDEINSNLSWKLIGVAENGKGVQIPLVNDYNEFVFIVKKTGESVPIYCPITIPALLLGTDSFLCGGYYVSNSNNFAIQIRMTANGSCYVSSAKHNSTEFSIASSLLFVYGKR